jgi:hypothetical protein
MADTRAQIYEHCRACGPVMDSLPRALTEVLNSLAAQVYTDAVKLVKQLISEINWLSP